MPKLRFQMPELRFKCQNSVFKCQNPCRNLQASNEGGKFGPRRSN
jgi:hypothetical protein